MFSSLSIFYAFQVFGVSDFTVYTRDPINTASTNKTDKKDQIKPRKIQFLEPISEIASVKDKISNEQEHAILIDVVVVSTTLVLFRVFYHKTSFRHYRIFNVYFRFVSRNCFVLVSVFRLVFIVYSNVYRIFFLTKMFNVLDVFFQVL